ncbi:MAG: VanW family protein [Leptospiraceae bacterium]|nr:VanW family protein [Leptospiraceae bacterium]
MHTLLRSLLFILLLFFPVLLISEESPGLVVSYFEIDLKKHNPAVHANLRLASEKLNKIKIPAKSQFSFNKTVGSASLENGYHPATVYSGENVISEPGGGICIAATLVYNTLLLSGFTIKERYKHSRPVSYVPPGLDATISYGLRDMRMINPYNRDFVIEMKVENERLIGILYSDFPLSVKYLPRIEVQEDEISSVSQNSGGRSIHVYLDQIKEGETVRTKYLYTDFLNPLKKY